MIRKRGAAIAVSAWVLSCIASGCILSTANHSRRIADVRSLSVPDSLAQGEALPIEVTWLGNCTEHISRRVFRQGEHTLELTLWSDVATSGVLCPGYVLVDSTSYSNPPVGEFTLRVYGLLDTLEADIHRY